MPQSTQCKAHAFVIIFVDNKNKQLQADLNDLFLLFQHMANGYKWQSEFLRER